MLYMHLKSSSSMTATSLTVACLSSWIIIIHLQYIPSFKNPHRKSEDGGSHMISTKRETSHLTVAKQQSCFMRCGLLLNPVENEGLLSQFWGVLDAAWQRILTWWRMWNFVFSIVVHKKIWLYSSKDHYSIAHHHFQKVQWLMQFLRIQRWPLMLCVHKPWQLKASFICHQQTIQGLWLFSIARQAWCSRASLSVFKSCWAVWIMNGWNLVSLSFFCSHQKSDTSKHNKYHRLHWNASM